MGNFRYSLVLNIAKGNSIHPIENAKRGLGK